MARTGQIDSDRTSLWLPLLQELSRRSSSWLIYKNADSALHGVGDVDSTASPDDWDTITGVFRSWARDLGPSAVCSHIPGGLNLIAVPTTMTHVLEIGLKQQKSYRGSILFEWDQLMPLATWDDRGFRELRPGAEALLKLILNGINRDSSKNVVGIESKAVVEGLEIDFVGAVLAAESLLSGRASAAAVDLAESLVEGGWQRGAARSIQISAYSKALLKPRWALQRARFRGKASSACPITEVLLGNHRVIPDQRSLWWSRVVDTHRDTADPE